MAQINIDWSRESSNQQQNLGNNTASTSDGLQNVFNFQFGQQGHGSLVINGLNLSNSQPRVPPPPRTEPSQGAQRRQVVWPSMFVRQSPIGAMLYTASCPGEEGQMPHRPTVGDNTHPPTVGDITHRPTVSDNTTYNTTHVPYEQSVVHSATTQPVYTTQVASFTTQIQPYQYEPIVSDIVGREPVARRQTRSMMREYNYSHIQPYQHDEPMIQHGRSNAGFRLRRRSGEGRGVVSSAVASDDVIVVDSDETDSTSFADSDNESDDEDDVTSTDAGSEDIDDDENTMMDTSEADVTLTTASGSVTPMISTTSTNTTTLSVVIPVTSSSVLVTPSVSVKTMTMDKSPDDDSECCSICFESWTTTGEHRIASLKCGHLFGLSCIEKWLKGQGSKCPQCNSKAVRKDIRVIFAKTVQALDTCERDRALSDLEKEREARRKAEMDAAHSRVQCQLAFEECKRLKDDLQQKQQQLSYLKTCGTGMSQIDTSSVATGPDGRLPGNMSGNMYMLERTIEISRAGNCRVMTFCGQVGTLVISKPSSNPLFPGYGVQKVCCLDLKTTQYIALHQNHIRDLAVHPYSADSLLLSASLDKTVKITSLLSNVVVQSYTAPGPVWSCAWNLSDRNYIYAGLANGTIVVFDLRNTAENVRTLNVSRKPVVGLRYVITNNDHGDGGLLVGQLDSTSFYEMKPNNDYKIHLLALEGQMTSLSVELSSRCLLASFRPTATNPSVRHQVCSLNSNKPIVADGSPDASPDASQDADFWSCSTIKTLKGGRIMKLLTRSNIYEHPGNNNGSLYVAAGDEASRRTNIWDASSGDVVQTLDNGGLPMLDVSAYRLNNNSFLATLTERNLRVFKWT